MTTGRQNKLTGQVAEHLVCAELGRRGLISTPFAGNVPTFDIIAVDAYCRVVPIQVKATRSDNWPTDARDWMTIDFDPITGVQHYLGPRQLADADLVYVCVALRGPDDHDRDDFFILTKADVQTASIASYSTWMDKHDWRRPKNPGSFDGRFAVSGIQKFKDNWELIKVRLSAAPKVVSPAEPPAAAT